MHSRLFKKAIILGWLCFHLTHAGAQEKVAPMPTLENARTSHAIAVEHLDRQIQAEQDILRKLKKLRADGHASWFEWSLQQRKVNELTIYVACLDEFQDRIREVDDLKSASQGYGDHAVSDWKPLKIFSPDSIRLLGWTLIPVESTEPWAFDLDDSEDLISQHPGIFTNAFNLAESPDLMRLTIRMLQHESQIKGPLKSSQLQLTYLENSLHQIEALCKARMLPESTRVGLLSKIKQTNEHILQENQRRQRLGRLANDLVSQLNNQQAISTSEALGSKTWTSEVVAEEYFLDHLMALHQQQLILKAQRKVAILDLDFWRKAFQRLPKNETNQTSGSGVISRYDVLTMGSALERQKYAHKINGLELKIESLKQQQVLFDLEERRFLKVCTLLKASRHHQPVSISNGMPAFPSHSRPSGFVDRVGAQATGKELEVSYGPSDFLDPFRNQLAEAFEGRSKRKQGAEGSISSSFVIVEHPKNVGITKPKTIESKDGSYQWRNKSAILEVPFHPNAVPTNLRQPYQYGELKAKYRSQARVGQIPWYLPGSPSNLGGQR